MSIDIQHVHKHFGAFHALNDVSLQVKQGELVSLLGPSGCGKTTLLRIIAGLETADEGQVILNGETATRIPVRERQVGFVFQQYALFKHMTVFDNVAFGLRMKSGAERPSRDEIKQKVMRLLEMVQLDNLAKRYPAQLSGGQRQRIALARALAVDPKVLLLDEPFGALDAQVRKDLRRWMRHLHDELNIASVFVTHDQEEALELSDRVVMMNQGKIEQVGTPREIWAQPASDFVYGFLGDVNTLEGVTEEQGLVISGLPIPVDLNQWGAGRSVRAYVRPHDIAVSVSPIERASEFSLKHSYLAGSRAYLEVQQGTTGQVLEVEMATQEFFDLDLKPSQTLWVHIKKAHLLPQS